MRGAVERIVHGAVECQGAVGRPDRTRHVDLWRQPHQRAAGAQVERDVLRHRDGAACTQGECTEPCAGVRLSIAGCHAAEQIRRQQQRVRQIGRESRVQRIGVDPGQSIRNLLARGRTFAERDVVQGIDRTQAIKVVGRGAILDRTEIECAAGKHGLRAEHQPARLGHRVHGALIRANRHPAGKLSAEGHLLRVDGQQARAFALDIALDQCGLVDHAIVLQRGRRRRDVIQTPMRHQIRRGTRAVAIAIAAARHVDAGVARRDEFASVHRDGTAGGGFLAHRARHRGHFVGDAEQQGRAFARIDRHCLVDQEAILLQRRIGEIEAAELERQVVRFIRQIDPQAGCTQHAVGAEIDPAGLRGTARGVVIDVFLADDDAPPRRHGLALVHDGFAGHLDHGLVVRKAARVVHRIVGIRIRFGQRGAVVLGQGLGHAVLAGGQDAVGIGGLLAGGIVILRLQPDRAVHRGGRVGRDQARLVDDQSRQRGVAAIGMDLATEVGHAVELLRGDELAQVQRTIRGRRHLHQETTHGQVVGIVIGASGIVVELQVHGLACCQNDLAVVGGDDAVVLHLGREQHDGAPFLHRLAGRRVVNHLAAGAIHLHALDRAVVDHLAGGIQHHGRHQGRIRLADQVRGDAVVEGALRNVERRGDQCVDVDLRGAIEQDAVGIDQVDLAVGRQGALDHRGIGTADVVHGLGRTAGLVEADRVALADVKAVPADRRFRGRLVDLHQVGRAVDDAGGAGVRHHAAGGQRIDRCGGMVLGCQRKRRAGRQDGHRQQPHPELGMHRHGRGNGVLSATALERRFTCRHGASSRFRSPGAYRNARAHRGPG